MRQTCRDVLAQNALVHRDDDFARRFARPQRVQRLLGAFKREAVADMGFKFAVAIPIKQRGHGSRDHLGFEF